MFCNCIFNEKRLGMNHPSLKFAFFTLRFTEEPLCPGCLQTFDVTIRKFLSLLYFRFAKVPNARLGPIFKKDENHPFISLFLEMGRRWATRWLGSARRSV